MNNVQLPVVKAVTLLLHYGSQLQESIGSIRIDYFITITW